MRLRQIGVVPLIVTASGILLGGCGSPSTSRSEPASSSQVNDPALSAAADVVEPMLERSFPKSFAGLELDRPRHQMTKTAREPTNRRVRRPWSWPRARELRSAANLMVMSRTP
jgi:hypothetical protein